MRIREKLLSRIWELQLIVKDTLHTVGGEELQVIYSGRENNDSGPDYCDAQITIGGGLPLKGDIELHVRSHDWGKHGHHKDPNYNGVILHVVMWNDGDETSLLQSGRTVPILALCTYLTVPLEELQNEVKVHSHSYKLCYGVFERHDKDALAELLDKAGEERFYFKVEKFRKKLEIEKTSQVIYEGVMRALGYAKNKETFEELARILPLSVLKEYAKKGDIYKLQALMLGKAGLLPTQRYKKERFRYFSSWVNPEVARLERIWISSGIEEGLKKLHWRFFRVRPENFPTRRIAGASYLLTRYGDGEKLEDMLDVRRQVPFKEIQRDLERSLVVMADGYWANHFDFGLEGKWNRSLIGLGRAREIIVNILLPLFFALAEKVSRPWFRELAMELYFGYPCLGKNWITRYMEKQIFGKHQDKLIDSACREQGLIHLYESFCQEHRCSECPLA